MIVTKRDGTKVSFETKKIINAVSKANAQTQEMTDEDITRIVQSVEAKCQKLGEKFSVESIQDIIEDTLLKSRFNKTAKAFILHRDKRTRIRESKSRLIREVGQRLKGNGIVNQNANVDEASFSGRKGEATNTLTKWYALEYCMSEKSKENHLNNEIYVHDLDHYSIGAHNCLSIPFDQLLAKGFTSRQTDIRPASSINTAFQLVAVIFQLQSLQQFGGVSATHLDWTMVPYVRKSFAKHYRDGLTYIDSKTEIDYEIEHMLAAAVDYSITDSEYEAYSPAAYKYAMAMTLKELNQAVEGMMHNLNTLQSRSGGQVPFSSINYGTCTLPEGRMVIKALLDGTIMGVGKYHRTSIFPCCIFQYMKGVNDKPGTPNYDLYRLALKATAKRFYPNYALCSWSVNAAGDEYDVKVRQACVDQLSSTEKRKLIDRLKSDSTAKTTLGLTLVDNQIVTEKINDPRCYFSTMGCRTSNGADINFKYIYNDSLQKAIKGESLKDVDMVSANQKDGRGNLAPVTIILPTLAMRASRDVEAFMELLDTKIHEAKDMLLERYDFMCAQTPEAASFMYDNRTMAGFVPSEGIRSALRHGTLVIGQLGLAETLEILIGKNHTTPEGMALAKRIEGLFNKRCVEFKQKYELNFGVYLTPAENLAYTAMTKFKKEFGEIPRISDHEYFTNSIHVPVWQEIDAFDKIDTEAELTGFSNAGCITYVELSESAQSNIDALETLVNYAMDKDIPYFALNLSNDFCMNCQHTGEFTDHCTECGSTDIQQLRRVTGYLSCDYHNFNYGKQKEVEDRVKHI